MGIEFYQYKDELWYKTDGGENRAFTEDDVDMVQLLLQTIRECYPKAYKALENEYEKSSVNSKYYQWLMARRFCKCNFGKLETTKFDIEPNGNFNFESIECPLRGECKNEGIICNPSFNTKLSDAEERVMRLVSKGISKEKISEMLYISPHTVKNHIKSAYLKLGIHDQIEFMRYVTEHNLYND